MSYLTARITLVDLAAVDVAVTVTYLDPSSKQTAALGAFSLHADDQLSRSIPAGRYQLDFRLPAASATGPRCTLTVMKGDAYTFAAVGTTIAVARHGYQPAAPAELFVATSSLCRA